ncbi:MAG: hypothetical protein Q9162_006881 [Coniocarpon cinnabarinum]
MATLVPGNSQDTLMRQALLHSKREEDTDQIGSTASTPPGISTPQPDPHDKRLPGILSSYFGQVGNLSTVLSSSSRRKSATRHPSLRNSSSRPSSPSHLSRRHTHMCASHPRRSMDKTSGRSSPTEAHLIALPDSPMSRPSSCGNINAPVPLLQQEGLDRIATKKQERLKAPQPYPTPPTSSSSGTSEFSHANPTPPSDKGQDNSKLPRTNESPAKDTGVNELVTRLRRQTLSSKPQSGVVTSTVHAAHISPPTPASTCAPLSSLQAIHAEDAASRRSSEGLTKITSRQNTPPRTPRSLSQTSKPSRTSSPSTRPALFSNTVSDSSLSRDSTADAVLGEVKGKLAVSISSGRGLRPSSQPYVICQFQSNEYISKGPRSDSDATNDSSPNSLRALPMQRSDSGTGRAMAIPMRSRQSSHTGINSKEQESMTEPVWNHDATFDVVGDDTELDVSVYDHSRSEAFLGHVRFSPQLTHEGTVLDQWFKLEPRHGVKEEVSGEIHLRLAYLPQEKRHNGPEDFGILKLIGKGTFGQVFQVRKKDTQRVYAMKVLSKKVIVQKKEVQHTVGERNILVRTAMTHSPFIVGLKFSFQTPTDLYLVTDYMSGGELFWHLQKEGRFHEARAKFYIAELILALQHLHQHDIVYRDLKPENILLDANGHIALCDFGLSKANLTKDETTNTFCGTTEYLAPEVLLDEAGYTKMVDFWSLGVLVFEMCCGWSPFYAEDTQQMYKNIAFGKVRFPRDALSTDGRNFVKGLLNRNPKHRLGANGDAEELKNHAFFADIDWQALGQKDLVPPFKPRLKSETDTQNFDPEFTNALNGASSLNARAAALASGIDNAATPLSPTMQAKFKGFTFVDESSMDKNFEQRQANNEYDEDDDEDAMEEDDFDTEDDMPDWEYSPGAERMSGITRTATGGHGPEDGMFHGDEFEGA